MQVKAISWIFMITLIMGSLNSINSKAVNIISNSNENSIVSSKSSTSRCRRHPLIVTPSEVMWPNVISPQELDLGLCSGNCPLLSIDDKDYTNNNKLLYRVLLDRFRLRKPTLLANDMHQPCCVPVSYKPVEIQETMPDGSISNRTIFDMTVDTCACI